MKWLLLSVFFIITACGPTMPDRHRRYIVKSAVKDLQCKKSKIKIKPLKKNQYRVRGCNSETIYGIKCNPDGSCETSFIKVPTIINSGYSQDENND